MSAEDAAALFQTEHDRLASSSGTVAYKAPEEEQLPLNTGPGPSGTLTILKTKVACPGCEPACGTIKLEYKIPDGIQFGYHPHAGVKYEGTNRAAYLPDNPEGRQLLTRYQLAWLRGYSMDIGYSVARKKDDSTRWTANVPHKTALSKGGDFGFPDESYLQKANESLDKIGSIPDANACLFLLPHARTDRLPPLSDDLSTRSVPPADEADITTAPEPALVSTMDISDNAMPASSPIPQQNPVVTSSDSGNYPAPSAPPATASGNWATLVAQGNVGDDSSDLNSPPSATDTPHATDADVSTTGLSLRVDSSTLKPPPRVTGTTLNSPPSASDNDARPPLVVSEPSQDLSTDPSPAQDVKPVAADYALAASDTNASTKHPPSLKPTTSELPQDLPTDPSPAQDAKPAAADCSERSATVQALTSNNGLSQEAITSDRRQRVLSDSTAPLTYSDDDGSPHAFIQASDGSVVSDVTEQVPDNRPQRANPHDPRQSRMSDSTAPTSFLDDGSLQAFLQTPMETDDTIVEHSPNNRYVRFQEVLG